MSDYSSDALATPPVSAVERGRRAYRRKQTTRSVLISLASTIVVGGHPHRRGRQLRRVGGHPQHLLQRQVLRPGLPPGPVRPVLNIRILLIAVLGVAVFATLLAAARTLAGPVFFPIRFLAAAYTDIFRGVPFLVVLYLIGFGIPALNPTTRIPTAVLGTVALVLTYSSYVAEVLRAGLDSVHPSQRYAARSLGLTHGQTLRMIIVPQAIRKVTPALMNDFISMQKDVGLISVLGAVDAIRSAQMVQAKTYNMTSYVVAGLLFIVLSFPFIRLSAGTRPDCVSASRLGDTV